VAPLVAFAASGSVKAEQAQDVLQLAGEPKQYVEFYLENPKVSGNLLVGVRWARADDNPAAPAKFDPNNVRLIVPARLPVPTACVNVASRDGRYTAENLYVVPPDVAREPALYAETRYPELNENYNIDNIAVMIRSVPSCDAANFGEIIPAVLVPKGVEVSDAISAVPALVVAVNADPESVELSLQRDGGPKLSASCEGADKAVNISYSAVCKFHPERRLESGQYSLTLTIKERFKKVKTPFKLLISE